MLWEIWESEDRTEIALTESGHPDQKDTDGRRMLKVKVFEAATWEEARQIQHDHYGWGKYSP